MSSSKVQLAPLELQRPSTSSHSSYGSPQYHPDLDNATSPTSSSSRQDNLKERTRRRTTSAKKFLHENAPGITTLVAGHSDVIKTRPVRTAGGKGKKSSKRYSNPEIAHLVPDEDGGSDLHDPEYQAIKIVRRRPSVSTISSTDEEGEDDFTDSLQQNRRRANGRSAMPHYTYSSQTTLHSDSHSSNKDRRPSSSSSATSRRDQYHYSSTYQPPLSSSYAASTYTNTNTGSLLPPSALAKHASNRPASVSTRSTDRSSSWRTYNEGPATYIAPSVTMRPDVYSSSLANQHSSEGYNPYTYVPTTTTNAQAFSHSHFKHPAKRPESSSRWRDNDVNEIAPPIAWQSSYIPSADHSERHRTSHHDKSNMGNDFKRNIQSIKLDISLGLMRLGKKK